jgi:hypothetical protein
MKTKTYLAFRIDIWDDAGEKAEGKCEGRKSHAERNPELVALAKQLHRHKPKGGRMSLRAISAELAARGFLNENGRPFAAASIKSMLHS